MSVVLSVHRSGTHSFSKATTNDIELVAGLGVAGDAHQGARVKHRSRVAADPTQPNLRQVHLLHGEVFQSMAEQGFAVQPGDLGENVTTSGVDLLGLPTGTVLKLGPDALVALTGLRNPCGQITGFQDGLLATVLERDETGQTIRRAGVMAVVVRGGVVRSGDRIETSLPPKPHHALKPV